MTSSVSKTRKLLVDVARQLFAHKGITNTTMNDIAVASKKGRRTLYTYFKNKNDVFLAVVDSELKYLYSMLEKVATEDIPADIKFENFIITRFNSIKDVVKRNGTLKAEFFRNIWKVEAMRRNFDKKEIILISNIIEEGIKSGIFDVPDPKLTAKVLHFTLKGYEVPYIKGVNAATFGDMIARRGNVMSLIFNGLRKREN